MCSGRVDPVMIMEGFIAGSDGVFVGACKKGECHYSTGNLHAAGKIDLTARILEMAGLNPARLVMRMMSSAEGNKFVEFTSAFQREIGDIGPLGEAEGVAPDELKIKLEAARKALGGRKLRWVLGKLVEFRDKGNLYDNPELPTWNPWVVVTDAAAQRYRAVRNPYYFKVDPEGNQLPYIDEIAHDLVEENELYLTKTIAGEIDMQGRHIGSAANFPVLKENEAKGDYRVLEWTPTLGNSYQIMFNQSFDGDPVVAKYITDKKFRQALSVAIDRDDFIEIVSLGQGTPRQVTVMDISPDFKPEYATRYIEYDTDKANAWLDELGLDQKDGEGFRVAPESGEALVLTISCIPTQAENNELIKEYWAKVGIKVVVKSEERSVHYERMSSNELQLSTWGMDGALYPLWLNYAYWIVPWIQGSSRIGPAFGLWRDTGGEQGTEPTGDMAEALELFDQAVAEVDEEKRIELASQVLDIASENVWAIGTYLLAKGFFVVKNNFRNVPEDAVSDWILRTPKNTHTEQYFIKS